LSFIREIRDKHTDLFKKIGSLPKKTRTAKNDKKVTSDSLVTFFRKGKLKKFCITQGLDSEEITFEDAVKFFECEKHEPKKALSKQYFEFLESNKRIFETPSFEEETVLQKGRSNQKDVINILKGLLREPKYTQADCEYIQLLLQAYQSGNIPTALTKKLKTFFDKEFDNLKLLSGIKSIVPDDYLNTVDNHKRIKSSQNEIVLSEFLYKQVGE